MNNQEENGLSPQFKYIKEQEYKALEGYVETTIKTLDDCILSVFHRAEDEDKIAFGEMVALRNVRNILVDNRKFFISKLEDYRTDYELRRKLHHHLCDFDPSKIELDEWEKDGETPCPLEPKNNEP